MNTDEDFAARFDSAVEQINARNAEISARDGERKGLWLSHHWADQYDRCVVIGGRHVCRRCLVFYPMTALLVFLTYAGLVPWAAGVDNWVIWTLSIIGSIDFALEQLGVTPYRPWRQIAASLLIGIGFGRAAGIELQDRWSPQFWTPLLVFGALWLALAAYGNRSRR